MILAHDIYPGYLLITFIQNLCSGYLPGRSLWKMCPKDASGITFQKICPGAKSPLDSRNYTCNRTGDELQNRHNIFFSLQLSHNYKIGNFLAQ